MPKSLLFYAACNGFLVVALGAFGAHALEERLDARMLEIWQTGVQYHMFHCAGLIAAHLLQQAGRSALATAAGYCFLGGMLLFCGSLYLLALSGWLWLGMITPLGGLVFLAGWVQLARASLRNSA